MWPADVLGYRLRFCSLLSCLLVAGCDETERRPGPVVEVDSGPATPTDGGPDGSLPVDLGAADLDSLDGGSVWLDAGGAPDQGPAGEDSVESGDGGSPASWPRPACSQALPPPDWLVTLEEGRRYRCPGTDGVALELEALEEGVLRLRYLPASGHARPSYALRPQSELVVPPLRLTTSEEGALLLCTPQLALTVTQAGCRVRAQDGHGTVLLDDPPDGGYREEAGGQLRLERRLADDEHLYGLGEKTGRLDRRGRTLIFRNTDAFSDPWGGFPPDADPLYLSIPFLIGLRGTTSYGLFTDNTHHLVFDLGRAVADRYTITASGGTLDQYLLAGPSLAEVVRRYTALTGRTPLPPRWALGYQQCRWGYLEQDFREVTTQFRERRLPADGIWFDIQHMDDFRVFTWDLDQFPDPTRLIAELAAQGFQSTVIVDPGIVVDPDWEIYQAGLAGEHYLKTAVGEPYVGKVWGGPSVFPDFSRFATRQWWGELVGRNVARGVRGTWIDMNEPANFVVEHGNTVPDEVLADGDGHPTTMAEIHNVYALLEAEATYDGMQRAMPGQRPFVLTRAGFAGIQRFAAVWTGDAPSKWEILAQTPAMLLGLGLSGVTFAGSDVGGYSGKASPELFARWIQHGLASPFFRGHTEHNGNRQEPWSFTLEVEDISRAVLEERYRLLPYLYSLFRETTQTGAPVLRPLVYEFQEDPGTHQRDDEYLLGPWLLLAPVLAEGVISYDLGEPNHRVYLPPGRWFEWHSGAIWDGPAELPLRLPLGGSPIFVREGAIVPRTEVVQWSGERMPQRLELDLYPARVETRFTLYEDDGISNGFQQGQFQEVRYTLQQTESGALFRARPQDGVFDPAPGGRLLLIRVRRVERGDGIVVRKDGIALPARPDPETLLAQPPGWWWDPADRSLQIAFPDTPRFELELEYSTLVDELRPPVPVALEVSLPPATPPDATITVATSVDWSRHQPLVRDGERARGEVLVPRGEWFYYKYARGGWETVEKWDGCVEALNRYGLGAAHPWRRDRVTVWRDQCE